METDHSDRFTKKSFKDGTLIVVADFMNGSSNVLDFAGAVASRCDARLELLQVVDPGQTRPSPDAEAGARSNLEKFSRKMRAMGTGVVKLLSFGSPEELIVKRSTAIDARLIIFPLTGSIADRNRKKLVSRLITRCACPVISFPLEGNNASPAELAQTKGLRALLKMERGPKWSSIEMATDFEIEIMRQFRGA